MRGYFANAFLLTCIFIVNLTGAQQYMGDTIPNSLPNLPGAEVAYWKINDSKNNNVTLINYISHGSNGKRLDPKNLKRAVVIIHGLNRDPGTYESNALSALSQVSNPDININTVAIVSPYFPNGDDKNYGYPWVDGLAPRHGSISNALVWKGSQWSAGGNNQYPYFSRSVSSYDVLDQIIQYFDDATLFPNMQQIIIGGHSLGAQTVQRYAAIGKNLNTRVPVNYWVANPNSFVWMDTKRPLSTASCSIYDDYREGYTNFEEYPMDYGLSLVKSGRPNILANYNSKAINYARGILDLGDASSSCAAETTGSNRNERFFNFIKAFPVSCPDPAGLNCDTVDFVVSGHDAGAMMAAPAGQARLFSDNFYGNRSRSYDFGYPRQQAGDDPFPNPALNTTKGTTNTHTYAGNMTYQGCWSDQTPLTLTNMTYQSNANTIELCTSTCAQGGNRIAGLEFGSQCFCGNSLGYEATTVIDSSCASTCPGNSSETCGGSNRLSLFSNGEPVVNPEPSTSKKIGNFNYSNCYTEAASGRALSGTSTQGSFVDLEYCSNFCSGYKYFGTEFGRECYCGNYLGTGANVTAAGDCSMTCAGDVTEYCGAGNRLTLYVNPDFGTGSSVSSPSGTQSATGSATNPGTSPTSTSVSCPASNNTVVNSNGKNFLIECGIDHFSGDLTSLTVSSFQQCIDACAQNAQCVDVSSSGSACYLKSNLGVATQAPNILGAKLVAPGSTSTSSVSTGSSSSSTAASTTTSSISSSSISTSSSSSSTTALTTSSSTSSSTTSPRTTSSTSSSATSSSVTASPTSLSCPSSNGTVHTTNGENFLIECGTDHEGGDMSSKGVKNFAECIDLCATTAGCVDVSLSGSACYLKSSVGRAIQNGVLGAMLMTGSTVSSSAVSSTSTSTSSSSTQSTTRSSTSSTSSTATSSATTSAPTSTSSSTTSSTLASSTSSTTASIPTTTSPSTTSTPTTLTTMTTTSSTSSSSTTSTTTSSTSSPPTPAGYQPKLTCPESNSTLYTASSGRTFLIECAIDHTGGDLIMKYVSSFKECVEACDATAGCVDVSLSGAACYLKKVLKDPRDAKGILGAKLIAV